MVDLTKLAELAKTKRDYEAKRIRALSSSERYNSLVSQGVKTNDGLVKHLKSIHEMCAGDHTKYRVNPLSPESGLPLMG